MKLEIEYYPWIVRLSQDAAKDLIQFAVRYKENESSEEEPADGMALDIEETERLGKCLLWYVEQVKIQNQKDEDNN